MGHPVTWFQISAADGGPLKKFYKKVFAWKLHSGPGGMTMVEPDKGGIAGGLATAQDGKSSVTVYIEVDNLKKHLAKVEKAGGKVAMPPMELPEGMGSIAGFLDPTGNWVGLWQTAPKKAKKTKDAKKPAKKKSK